MDVPTQPHYSLADPSTIQYCTLLYRRDHLHSFYSIETLLFTNWAPTNYGIEVKPSTNLDLCGRHGNSPLVATDSD
jgi:hypothetical protein